MVATMGFALVLAVAGCGGGKQTATAGATSGSGGAGGGSSSASTASSGSSGSSSSGGGSTPGHGPAATETVSAGVRSQSGSYVMVYTLGQPTQNQDRSSSNSYVLQGGLIGANGSLP
jgi:hypothetical protein